MRRLSGFSSLLLLVLLLTSCADAGPQKAARASFEHWAQLVSIPYQNEQFTTVTSDGIFAKVRVSAEFRDRADGPWEPHEAEIEVRKVGSEWQGPQQFVFRPTAQTLATRQAIGSATAAAVTAQRQATAVAREVATNATATVVTQALGTAEAIRSATARALESERRTTATAVAAHATEVAIATLTAPTPTPIPDTPPGSVLKVGESWHQDGMRMSIRHPDFAPGCNGFFGFEMVFENSSGGQLVTSIAGTDISITDNFGQRFTDVWIDVGPASKNCYPGTLRNFRIPAMNDGGVMEIAARVLGIFRTDTTTMRIHVERAGRISGAQWEISVPR